MERFHGKSLIHFGIILGLLAISPSLKAEVLLSQPSHGSSDSGEYPESYFGRPTGGRSPAGIESAAEVVVPKEGWTAAPLIENARVGVQEVSLIAGDMGFFPKTLFVTRGVPVRVFLTGASKNTLCLMMDSFNVRKQVSAQKVEEVTFTPTVPGQYRFYCPINGTEGTLVVRELPPTQESGNRMISSSAQ